MYTYVRSRLVTQFSVGVLFSIASVTLSAQHEGHTMAPEAAQLAPSDREGSGTAWLPDDTPMDAVHLHANDWMFMIHGNLFLQYLHESGDRGSQQTGSINWLMGVAERKIGPGTLKLRGMGSLEPWTIGGCGYPDLLATGETCNGGAIHDRQHPHDLFLELAAQYDRPLSKGLRLQLYGGPVGEPALGPVAFMHRVSGAPNALAPITHHWFDSTHITYGVATAGVYGQRWKLEGSVFNGREPDDRRTDFDFGAMDSVSARAWFLPSSRWALQVSAGHLVEAEAANHASDRGIDVDRVTASATYHRRGNRSMWANTFGWGRNAEQGGDATNALLLESSVTIADRDTVYGRFEWSQKSSHDLDVDAHGIFDIAKLQAGYTRYLSEWKGLEPGVGASVSAGIVPATLATAYGRRINPGFGLYVTVRP